jgi:hypothetical protein
MVASGVRSGIQTAFAVFTALFFLIMVFHPYIDLTLTKYIVPIVETVGIIANAEHFANLVRYSNWLGAGSPKAAVLSSDLVSLFGSVEFNLVVYSLVTANLFYGVLELLLCSNCKVKCTIKDTSAA